MLQSFTWFWNVPFGMFKKILNKKTQKHKINDFSPLITFLCTKNLLLLLFDIRLFLFCESIFNCFVFLELQKCFFKKFEFVLIASFALLLICTPIQEFFLTILAPIFLQHSLIFICVHLFLSVRVSSYLGDSLLIHNHL